MAALTQAQYDGFLTNFKTCIATLGYKVTESLMYGYNDQKLIDTFNYAVSLYNIYEEYDPIPVKCMHCDDVTDLCDEELTDTADAFNCMTTEEIKVIINHLSSICYECI